MSVATTNLKVPPDSSVHPAPAAALVQIHKSYRRGSETITALAGVDLEVKPGETVAVLGRSGSGKSTLLHILGALDSPDGGHVMINETEVGHLSAEQRAVLRRRQIGFVFQFFHLLPGLSVLENVALPLYLDGMNGHGRETELLVAVGLEGRSSHFPAQLSGGEMQRAAIARALVSRPALVVADEPTGNLDSATAKKVMNLLFERCSDSGAALIMATHDRAMARRADRVLSLVDGRLA